MGIRPIGIFCQRSGKVDQGFVKVVSVLVHHAPHHEQVDRQLVVELADDCVCVAHVAGVTTGLRHLKVSLGQCRCSGCVTGGFACALAQSF